MVGKLFIISAPSGTGKTSILKKVMSDVDRISFSVSHTTRQPRNGESDGTDYFFVDRDYFRRMIEEKAFLEWADVHGNYYGTAIEPVQEQLGQGRDVILDIDVQGAAIVQRERRLPATTIFIAPPTIKELEKRLRGRGTEDKDSIQKRLLNAQKEMAERDAYDYLVVNDTLSDAVLMICSIIYAERARYRRDAKGTLISLD